MADARWGAGIVPSGDAIADEYARPYVDELDGKPFDRAWLDRFAALHRVPESGGQLLMTVHEGTGEVGRDEAFGTPGALVATYQSRRVYARAARP